jgi:DNA-binding PadR family transcriptional regulator
MMKGYLQIIVLKVLSKASQSGYGLVKEIEKETKGWKPSFGSVYPLLEHLKNEGCVQVKTEKRKKVYSLTSEGKEKLKLMEQKKIEMIDRMIEGMKVMELFAGKEHAHMAIENMEQLKKGRIPFRDVHSEAMDLHTVLFEMDVHNKLGMHKDKVRAILKDATKKLRKLS